MIKKPKIYHGAAAVKQVEKKIGRPLTYAERRVVEEEGFVDGKYKDTKGIVTAGVGQTGKYINMSFEESFNDHVKKTKKLVPSLDSLPEDVQAELIQATYRGDLGGSPTFRKLLNAGKYEEAAQEFLNNKDYRESIKGNGAVAGRMQRVAEAVAKLAQPVEEPAPQEVQAPPQQEEQYASLANPLLLNELMVAP